MCIPPTASTAEALGTARGSPLQVGLETRPVMLGPEDRMAQY